MRLRWRLGMSLKTSRLLLQRWMNGKPAMKPRIPRPLRLHWRVSVNGVARSCRASGSSRSWLTENAPRQKRWLQRWRPRRINRQQSLERKGRPGMSAWSLWWLFCYSDSDCAAHTAGIYGIAQWKVVDYHDCWHYSSCLVFSEWFADPSDKGKPWTVFARRWTIYTISIAGKCQVLYFSRSDLRCQNIPCHFPFNVFGSFGDDFAGCSRACRTRGFAPALAKGSILGHLFGFSTGRGAWKVYAILTFRIFYRI